MVLSEVVEELLDVAAPRGDGAGSDEAVRLLAAAAVPQVPGLAADVGGVDDGADGLDAAVLGEPSESNVSKSFRRGDDTIKSTPSPGGRSRWRERTRS